MQLLIVCRLFLQVGPSLLVLGEEAQDNGLNKSLLERLQNLYKKTPQLSSHCCASLLTNYRCHKEIVQFSSSLFYEQSQQCQVPDRVAHPAAPFPLLFVCSMFLLKSIVFSDFSLYYRCCRTLNKLGASTNLDLAAYM